MKTLFCSEFVKVELKNGTYADGGALMLKDNVEQYSTKCFVGSGRILLFLV